MHVSQESVAVQVETTAYCLTFERTVDRWRHVLVLHGEDGVTLTSVEGQPDESTPKSPAFQELLVERPSEDVAEIQLFGQCGKQVYSAAVRCTEKSVHFDVCVRDRSETPGPARSTYHVSDSQTLRITPGLQDTTYELQPNGIEVRNGSVTRPTKGQSVRWAYKIGEPET